MNELENLRKKIDEIDKAMIALFEERMTVVCDIAKYKIKNNIPVLNKSREDMVMENILRNLNNKNYSDSATAFINEVMIISKSEQEKIISETNKN